MTGYCETIDKTASHDEFDHHGKLYFYGKKYIIEQ